MTALSIGGHCVMYPVQRPFFPIILVTKERNQLRRFMVINLLITLLVLVTAVPSLAATQQTSEQQKLLYAIGLSVAESLAVFDFSEEERLIVQKGIVDSLNGKKSELDHTLYSGKIQELARERRKGLGEKQVVLGKEFLRKAAKEDGAVLTESGMVFKTIVAGSGDTPKESDLVTVNYIGKTVEGVIFDSSFRRGRPLEFTLGNVINCWVEGIQKMKTGGRARFVCPPQLAYGDTGLGEKVLPGVTLDFEVELIGVKPGPPPATSRPVLQVEQAPK